MGYFFESDRAFEYKIAGGDKGLEVVKKDVGKYYTNENSIFINEIKINRKDLNEVIKKAKKISEKADWKIVAEQYWEKIYKPLLETQ